MSMRKKSEAPEKIVALITGASRGLGRDIAEELGNQGKTVIGTATTEEGAKKISERLASRGIKGEGLMLNVCDEDSITRVLEHIQEKWGTISVLVNNAGITRDNLLLRMKTEEWNEVIQTNLTGVFHLTKKTLRNMLKQRYGRIINVTSVVGVMGNPGQANYVAAKAGLIGFTKSLALEVAGHGITVNAVAPGFITSDMTNELNDKQKDSILSKVPMKRMGEPTDIAHAIVFLTSNNAGYITGQTLHVNGGMCMV